MRILLLIFSSIVLTGVSKFGFSEELSERLNVSTYLNKADFYPYSLTLSVFPGIHYLNFNQATKKFEDGESLLSVVTDIPADESVMFMYQLGLLENKSSCQSPYTGEVKLTDVMNVLINGIKQVEGDVSEPLPLDGINQDGYRTGKSKLVLSSNVIDEKALECRGSVLIYAELAL
ncbi:conserved hypothetical protein [Vibrio owensii]|uniref:Uncharacterized protein n=1 Tax=Vibrio owensii TaxID=696485 RepID=A0AAU9Q7U7_9VIBR|nr:conserved hypothetical protein [Vibrio owensii]